MVDLESHFLSLDANTWRQISVHVGGKLLHLSHSGVLGLNFPSTVLAVGFAFGASDIKHARSY